MGVGKEEELEFSGGAGMGHVPRAGRGIEVSFVKTKQEGQFSKGRLECC